MAGVELPTFDDYFIPVLRVLADGEVRKRRDIVEEASNLLGLSEEQRRRAIPSGKPVYLNRGNWAITHLNKAGAIESPKRAHWVITEAGSALLKRHPGGIDFSDFRREMSGGRYQAFLAPATGAVSPEEPLPEELATLTPFELVETGQQRHEEMVREELLTRLHQNDPAFFEDAVLELLIAMGYGGSLGKATRTQLSNDGGIDGVIDQDALGLSRIYVQAKRYASGHSVGRPEIQAFVGALHGAQANQGVFLTTSSYTPNAISYADSVPIRIVLIDGPLLTQLMIKHGVGVQVKRTVQMVEIDEDFFE
ncbi:MULTISPECIES: restriction endonuclease [Corynebacterium]|jgi:restriction system protein|uniref:restriction endonuclease n=1 Tax=Corynebacterium TaxID=1716 RepID=UPI00054E5415|nr:MULTISPECIES: restriction endonuclease [Corynebacterium]MCG7457122.1 restriction endonuclease [Corynebacterium sp. ACRPH]